MKRAAAWLAGILAITLPIAGCTKTEQPPPPPEPVRPQWTEIKLPMPPGEPGRIVLGSAATCAGKWFIGGQIATAAGETRPAAWQSSDGRTFTSMTLEPLTFYGRQALLYSVACRDGVPAAIGAKSGGAHGNPRTNTWYEREKGVLREIDAGYNLYGGPTALNVSRMAAGSPGWIIVGNRSSGAAAWLSPDSRSEFKILEDVKPLSGDDGIYTYAVDAAWSGGQWTVVGGAVLRGRIDRDPYTWTSADGATWQRHALPTTNAYDELQRVVEVNGQLIAAGIDGASFRAWRQDPDGWKVLGRMDISPGSSHPRQMVSLAASGNRTFVTVGDDINYAMWTSADKGSSWAKVITPAPVAVGVGRNMAITASDRQLLLLLDDAQSGRIWVADVDKFG